MAKQTLGRGFDTLIPKDFDTSILEDDKHRVQKIPINNIVHNPEQPRKVIDESAISELSDSIKQHGVLQPIIVVRYNGSYRIVAGERRWRAARHAKLTHMPAIVRSLKELEQVELALIENIQRVDLSPLEQALSVYRLQHQFNLSLDEIAKKLGKAPSTLSNLTRLLQLPEAARKALEDNRITEGHARAILSLKADSKLQEEFLSCILNKGWTVRQAEQFVLDTKKNSSLVKTKIMSNSQNVMTKKISEHLNLPVKIKRTAKGGELVISFRSDSELDELVGKLSATE